jgi:hypothetical protein
VALGMRHASQTIDAALDEQARSPRLTVCRLTRKLRAISE